LGKSYLELDQWSKAEVAFMKIATDYPKSSHYKEAKVILEQGLKDFIVEKIHHFILKKEALKNQVLLYRSKTIEERKKIPGLPIARADVILARGAILYLAMEELNCPSVLISCHGVRYGLLYKKLRL
jgi:exopolyphosphatase/guanosine-5'-triphosphate,3'-diphosphate pyrophosphatase